MSSLDGLTGAWLDAPTRTGFPPTGASTVVLFTLGFRVATETVVVVLPTAAIGGCALWSRGSNIPTCGVDAHVV